jgi:outer membrane protein assembly factor BamD (BamD/ComL family)
MQFILRKYNGIYLCALLLAIFLLFSCKSTADPYKEDLTSKEYFQKAVEASDARNYKLALKYYEAFQAQSPGDRDGNLWALYEIGLIHYKTGNKEKALEFFDSLLDFYRKALESESEPENPLPEAPRILAEKIKGKIAGEEAATEAE